MVNIENMLDTLETNKERLPDSIYKELIESLREIKVSADKLENKGIFRITFIFPKVSGKVIVNVLDTRDDDYDEDSDTCNIDIYPYNQNIQNTFHKESYIFTNDEVFKSFGTFEFSNIMYKTFNYYVNRQLFNILESKHFNEINELMFFTKRNDEYNLDSINILKTETIVMKIEKVE